MTVDGIPCTLRSPKVIAAIRTVFAAIQRHPRDWQRLRVRVRRITQHTGNEDDGTVAVWRQDTDEMRRLYAETEANPRLWPRQGQEQFLAHGQIELSRSLARASVDEIVATVAHECGHAVTRARDFEARERVSTDGEWSSELERVRRREPRGPR